MGKASRWLRNLIAGKKESRESNSSKFGGGDNNHREKKRWSFKSGRDSADAVESRVLMSASSDNVAWLRSIYSESDKEQNKHAIAVAAATAAAADAAIAAAQAAVAVVRLTSQGRAGAGAFGGVQEPRQRQAAVNIQTVFRAYLAKKALRALKALVKLQALVRGYLVRKQAAATLHSMQALIRAQATVRAHKSRLLRDTRPLRSLERFHETLRSENLGSSFHRPRLSGNLDTNGYDRSPKIVEIDTCRPKSRSPRSRTSPSVVDSTDASTLNTMYSPLPCPVPNRISIPDHRNSQDYDNWFRYSSTAHNTPRYMNCATTPTKSVCAADRGFNRFVNLPNCPNYMAKTQSFEAKVRSQSAPKQRPELIGPATMTTTTTRKRLPLIQALVESRASLSGIGMQGSCTRAQEAAAAAAASFNFKRAVVDRLDRSLDFGRDSVDRDSYLQRQW